MTESVSQRPQHDLATDATPDLEQSDREESQDTSIFPAGEGLVITEIRATDVDLGLRRVPAGFYVMVQHSGLEWRTENKPVLADSDVQWNDLIPIPSDPPALVSFAVHASFEFEPMLGTGEQLRELTITVEQLLDHSFRDLPFMFSPIDGDVVSPCSSLFVSVKRQEISLTPLLEPHRSATDLEDGLGKMTDQGHNALSRFRKFNDKRDLDRALECFQQALDSCPSDHPCLAAARSNMATAKLIHHRVYDNDTSLDVAFTLHSFALATRPAGHPDRSFTLLHLAMVHLARFKKRRNNGDIAHAETFLSEVADLSAAERYEHRAAVSALEPHAQHTIGAVAADGQTSLEQDSTSSLDVMARSVSGMQSLRLFERFGNQSELQQAILALEESLESTPCDDHQYIATLTNLGIALRHRFVHFGELSDLEEAISRQRDAVNLSYDGHPDRPVCLNYLGFALLTRFERLGELSDLEEAISLQRDAIELTPHDHPDNPGFLTNLGNSFLTRFERLGDPDDLDEALSRHRRAVELASQDHPEKPMCLTNLGYSLFTRFNRFGELDDLEDAISRQRNGAELTPRDHPERPARLNSLAISLMTRFDTLGELDDLEEAISTQREAVKLTLHDHPDKPMCLINLGYSFLTHFERFGQLSDLEEAISSQRIAVDLVPHDHPDRPAFLTALSLSIITRFERTGELSDLEEAISGQREILELTPDDHPEIRSRLKNIAISLHTRFQRLGELDDLEATISTRLKVISLTPHDHPHRPADLGGLGISFHARFEKRGELSDLEEAISKQREAIMLTPHDSPERASFLANLGIFCCTRFQRLGELSDLHDAILGQQEAVRLTPHDHPDRSFYLNSLGTSFRIRFEHLGELNDLEEALSKEREAVKLTPRDHPDRSFRLHNLTLSLLVRFERLGELSDLEEAVSSQRDAINVLPHDHPERPTFLMNLGISLLSRYDHLGELADVGEAISRQRDVVELTPHDHPAKPSRSGNLGNSLSSRFRRLGELSDLEEAISRKQDAVSLSPHDHPEKPLYLTNLATTLLDRFRCLGERNDLEKAIKMHQDAIDLTPHDHSEKPARLNNLGSCLLIRFLRFGDLSNLEAAISKHREVVDLAPDDHFDKPLWLYALGNSLVTRFAQLREHSDLEQAISSYSFAACGHTGAVTIRFRASQQWIHCARFLRHHSLLRAYSVSIDLLPQLAWIGLSIAHRYRDLLLGANLVREAAAAALKLGHPETAVEWLEQGRSIVWNELFQLRNSHDELSSTHPDYARRLRKLSIALEQASSAREKLLSPRLENAHSHAPESLQQEADNHRRIAIERDNLLQEIRKLPGYERFLLHKEYSQLRASAHSGPVVVLNAAENRCDALIVLDSVDYPVHVPLPSFSLQRSKEIQASLQTLVRHARGMPHEDRYGHPRPQEDASPWKPMLASLWKCVVKPVLDALAFSTPGDLSRIFWCPTGPFMFLPIHAAGFYGISQSQPGHKVFDFVISSYTPTLGILTSPPKLDAMASSDFRLLSVPQPPSDGQVKLPGAVDELKQIGAVITDFRSSRTSLVEASLGTVEEVLDLMKETDWVHFACHGVQDNEHPTESGLCLADRRRLRVSDMVGLSRPRGGLAFLSACQTARGDEDLSDEAIHIAAGMLFAGYGGVVGTMWSISDRVAPDVAKDVYEQLFRRGCAPDYREAARALHVAVGRLREGGASFHDWLPFIHVGL